LTEFITQILTNGLITGSSIAVVALGFSLVYHTTRIFHIAYAAIYSLGGYLCWYFDVQLGLGIVASLGFASFFSAASSVLIWLLLYKPLTRYGAAENELMVASIGIMIMIIYMISLVYGTDPKLPGPSSDQLLSARTLQITTNGLLIILMLVITNISDFGLKMRALRDNPRLIGRLGINSAALTTLLFIASGVLVGMEASLSTYDLGISPFTGIHVFINAFIAVIAGGSGRVSGAVIGGFVLGMLQAIVVFFAGSAWILSVSFILLIAIMLFKPDGITGIANRND